MKPSKFLLWSIAVVGLVLGGTACDGNGETAAAVPTATGTASAATPSPAASATPATAVARKPAASPAALVAGVAAGGPCPVDQSICDFGVAVFDRVKARDRDGLMAIALPRSYPCPDPADDANAGKRSICEGAAEGEKRPGYSNVHGGGTGLATEDQFKSALYQLLEKAATADGTLSDGYGTGELRIASIGCVRPATSGAGTCGTSELDVTLTYITAHGDFDSTGRVTFHVYFQQKPGGGYGVYGVGQTTPPEAALYSFERQLTGNGTKGTYACYAWSPA